MDFKAPDMPRQTRSKVLKRQVVGRKGAKILWPKHHRPLWPTLLSALAIGLLTAGLVVVANTLKHAHNTQERTTQAANQAGITDNAATSDVPAEGTPPILSDYHVAADLPRYFRINKLGIDARIQPLDLGVDNVLRAPATIYDVGWYKGSAKPGANGAMLMDGHNAGPTKHGVFYDIKNLQKGDKVVIERGDGAQFTYTVVTTETFDFDKVNMTKLTTSVVKGQSGLNFMTSSGRFNVRNNQYEQRVAVYAVQS